MVLSKKAVGRQGEKIAQEYLMKKGYQVLENNFQIREGEIDLICLDLEKTVVFIEVKTRQTLNLGYPEEAVNQDKQAKMLAVAQEYVLQHPEFKDYNYCFDVIAIELNFKIRRAKIRHFKNILSG